jgi:2-oxoglutarate dehydrogenase E2 component (dihydrolipoamide succinyltransferase)
MSVMRKKIAEHMVLSARTSPHVYSVYEVDFHRVSKLRAAKKGEFERLGANLTFTAFIAKAVIDALRQHPIVNASVDGDNIVYKKDINLGIAVALDWGLIVPVIKNADEKNLLGLSRAIADVAERARSKRLNPDEVHGGTFTITNPGQFGAVLATPIINQPQVAILDLEAIVKRPVVVQTPRLPRSAAGDEAVTQGMEDAIAIHPMAYLCMSWDHRALDGADAARFLAAVRERLERWEPRPA